RDGRHVVNSMIHSGFKAPTWAGDFQAAARAWAHFANLATRFAEERPDRCLTVPHAGLVAEPEAWFGRVLAFVGASPSAAPAAYFRTNRINSSFDRASLHRRGGRRPRGSAHWRGDPDPWRAWLPEQRRCFVEEAGPTLIRLGFARAEDLVA